MMSGLLERPGRPRPEAPREPPAASPRPAAASARWLLLVLVAALPLFFWDLRGVGFAPFEGRYAEVAREMLLGGDWITPHMNGEVFLNKPPLMFWLAALVFHAAGLNESARLVSGLAALGTLILLYDLGRRIWRPQAGVWAAAVFLTAGVTTLESRQLRPDSLLTFCLCLTVWGALRAGAAGERPDRIGIGAAWTGIGLGVMTKGLLGIVLPLLALAPALLLSGDWRQARRAAPLWGLALAAALILPWHVAAGLANDGFWWDYVVNQHLLAFFDKKFPRDHIPDPLWYMWAIFAARLFPWVFLLPAALARQVRRARAARTTAAVLPLTWLGTIGLFFSASGGRLEQYLIPAVPAGALLIGALCDAWSQSPAGGHRLWQARLLRAAPFLLTALLGLTGALLAPRLLTATPALRPIALTVMGLLGVGGTAAVFLALSGQTARALGLLAVTAWGVGWMTTRGLEAVEPAYSVRPLIARLDPRLVAESALAYEAGEEYQLCGGLNFYLRRKLLLLEPPGFIPPTYLKRHVGKLFVGRPWFREAWARGDRRILLFSDPEKPPDRPSEYPQPHYEVARGGRYAVLTNLPLPR